MQFLTRSVSTVSWPLRLAAWGLLAGGGFSCGIGIEMLITGEGWKWGWGPISSGLVVLYWGLTLDWQALPDGATVEQRLFERERQRRSLLDRPRPDVVPARVQRPARRVAAWLLLAGAGATFALTGRMIFRQFGERPLAAAGAIVAVLSLLVAGFWQDAAARGEPPLWHRLRARRRGR